MRRHGDPELPAIVVTIATFIGLQGVSLLLRPTAAGMIDDAISDAAQFPLWLLPAGVALTLAMVAGAEWVLYRTGFGRSFRAVDEIQQLSLQFPTTTDAPAPGQHPHPSREYDSGFAAGYEAGQHLGLADARVSRASAALVR